VGRNDDEHALSVHRARSVHEPLVIVVDSARPAVQILKVRFRTNSEFAESYQAELSGGGLFCPTTTPLRAGTPVICELTVPALPNKVLIRGTVRAWRPALPRLRVRAGATVEFATEEAEKRDFI